MSNVIHESDETDCRELLGAAAFGHLNADEQVAFAAWIQADDQGRREFLELVAAVQLLPLSIDAISPSEKLRSRIAAAVGAGSTIAETPSPRNAQEPVAIASARSGPQALLSSPFGRILAAAAVLVVVVIGAFVIFDAISGETIESIAIDSAPEGFDGSLDYNVDDSEFAFVVESMPPAPEGQVYQAWLIRDGQPESFGVMTGTEMVVDANRDEYEVFAITVEPGPNGSTAPTTTPVLTAPLSRSEDAADV